MGGWAADRFGRINGIFFAAIFSLVGGALQSATQSSDFILVARVVTGLGTGGTIAEYRGLSHRAKLTAYSTCRHHACTGIRDLEIQPSWELSWLRLHRQLPRHLRCVLARLWPRVCG